jgi:hypothetical protein
MEAGSVPAPSVPAVEKRQYRNNTLGWLGVVILDPMGKQAGVSVEPQGTVWLSDAEAVLTARAPRLAKDNPFEEQVFYETEVGTGKQLERRVRPLVPIDEARWVPQEDRYLPDAITGTQAAGIAAANARAEEPAHATAASDPVAAASAAVVAETDPSTVIPPAESAPAAIPGQGLNAQPVAQPAITVPDNSALPGQQAAPPAPTQPPTAPPAGADVAAGESWTERPTAQPVVPGELQGAEATPEQLAAEAAAEQPTVVASSGSSEETAAVATPAEEETGASVPPQGDAPEGEFAVHEETGNPDAAAAQAPAPAEEAAAAAPAPDPAPDGA